MTDLVEGAPLRALLDAAADSGASERELLIAATRAITALLGERGSCVLVDGKPRVVLSTHAPLLSNWPLDLARYPEMTLALEQGAVIAIEDAHADPRLETVRSLLPHHLRSVAVVPLAVGGRRLGLLLAQSTSVRRMSPQETATAALVGRLAAHLVEAVRLRGSEAGAPPIKVPPALVPGSAGIPLAQRERVPAREARRVLVVEDDLDTAASIAQVLEDEGYRVETAADGVEGVRRARETQPDLILLDVWMPLLDGFSASEQLNADPLTRDVPILFLSGADDLMVRVRGAKAGAADFLHKPFSVQELLARIEHTLALVEARDDLRSQANVDELTALGNFRYLRQRMAVEESRRDRYGTWMSMVMLDVDKLKRINDQHGHAIGSQVLAAIGRVLREEVRDTDVGARYGGDEFVVLLPHADPADAMGFAQRALEHIRGLRPAGLEVTVSIGVASLDPRSERSLTWLLEQADQAAYAAKRLGGDHACACPPDAELKARL